MSGYMKKCRNWSKRNTRSGLTINVNNGHHRWSCVICVTTLGLSFYKLELQKNQIGNLWVIHNWNCPERKMRERGEFAATTRNWKVLEQLKNWCELAARTYLEFVLGHFVGNEFGLIIFCTGRTEKSFCSVWIENNLSKRVGEEKKWI